MHRIQMLAVLFTCLAQLLEKHCMIVLFHSVAYEYRSRVYQGELGAVLGFSGTHGT